MTRVGLREVLCTSYNRYSCLIIIVCQLIALLCVGTIIYIVAAVFVPTHKLKYSGFGKNGALCSTVVSTTVNGCVNEKVKHLLPNVNSTHYNSLTWSSCAESCPVPSLTNDANDTEPTSPPIHAVDCPQLLVNVRYFGTDIILEGCENYDVFNCDTSSHQAESVGTGIYSCVLNNLHIPYTYKENASSMNSEETNHITCTEISSFLKCDPASSEEVIDCSSGSFSCFKQPGLYQCNTGSCSRVKEPHCNRICAGIRSQGKNVLIHQRDKVHLAYCRKAYHQQSKQTVWPVNVKNLLNPSEIPTLLLNCQFFHRDIKYDGLKNQTDISLVVGDCVDGIVMENASLPESLSLPELLSIWETQMTNADFLLDPINQKYAPPVSSLSLYWNIPLYFYYDPCGNLPTDLDCALFYNLYGSPKHGPLPQSTFPCFYSTKTSTDYIYAVVRPTRIRTEKEIWTEAVIPTAIAIVSCFVVLVFVVIVTVVVFLHPLTVEALNASEDPPPYDSIGGNTNSINSKRPSIILTMANNTQTTVDNFSPLSKKSHRRYSQTNLSGGGGDDGRKRVQWIDPGPLQERWAYKQ